MRGKKIDNEFLSQFITQCAKDNKCLPEEIIIEAKKEIEEIDFKIKEVEKLKVKRSKLLDVITVFDKPKNIKNDNSKILDYFNIENQHICKFICDSLTLSGLQISSIKSNIFSESDILYCVKQLLERKIIYRSGDCVVRGAKFEEYYKVLTGI